MLVNLTIPLLPQDMRKYITKGKNFVYLHFVRKHLYLKSLKMFVLHYLLLQKHTLYLQISMSMLNTISLSTKPAISQVKIKFLVLLMVFSHSDILLVRLNLGERTFHFLLSGTSFNSFSYIALQLFICFHNTYIKRLASTAISKGKNQNLKMVTPTLQ